MAASVVAPGVQLLVLQNTSGMRENLHPAHRVISMQNEFAKGVLNFATACIVSLAVAITIR